MILNDPQGNPPPTGVGGRTTLDDLFRRAAERHPAAVALIDPPNRDRFADGPPRRLTYAEADRVISAIAGRLRRIGLRTDEIVGLQLVNSVECVLALLAVWRAGLIAMPLPLLWRQADALAAFGRVSVHALIASGRIGEQNQLDLALKVAAEVFPIRYICGFGERMPDGVTPLDDLFTAERLDPIPDFAHERTPLPDRGAHVAAVTWEVTPEGLIPVGRSHAELVTGGLAVLLEGRFEQHATILNTMTMSSFAGIAIPLVPWLLVGGTLALHHPFDPSTFVDQLRSSNPDAVVLPGPLVGQLAEAGCLSHDRSARILAVWCAPDRLSRATTWRDDQPALIDIQVFGETGLIPARRSSGGRPEVVPYGVLAVPRGTKGGVIVGEVRRTTGGTVAMRGPMVPRCAFPPGIERTSLPQLRVSLDGFVDTGYGCWNDRDNNAALAVTGPPPGVISVGGYRFVMRDLQAAVKEADASATLAALPDAIVGHRLAGSAADRARTQSALAERGANPLLIDAFRERRPTSAGQTHA